MKVLRLKIKIKEKKNTNNIIIDNKTILLRTTSISNRFINFKNFKYEKQEQIDFSNLKNKINNNLDNFELSLFISYKNRRRI